MRMSCAPRRGGVSPLVVLSLAMLVGVTAIAVDGGGLMEERRHVQATADAAALAAAADLYAYYASNSGTDPSNTARDSARATAAANGYSNDGVNSVVTTTFSPNNYQDGPNKGNAIPAGYVEVIVQSNLSRTFSNFFSSDPLPVKARAVARGQWTSVGDDVIALNLTGSGTVSLSGSSSLSLTSSLRINSSSSSALSVSGTGTVTASKYYINKAAGALSVSLLGLLTGSGGGSPTVSSTTPIADPLRYLPAPSSTGLTNRGTNTVVSGLLPVNLYPGVYSGGITVSNGTAILHANANGTPGIYYLSGGGFNVSGVSTVTTALGETAGVMIYNAWGSSSDVINLSGSGTLSLIPCSSGTYKGITIFQKRGTTASPGPTVTISGLGVVNVTGTIYVVHGQVALSSSAITNVLGGQVIADSLSLTGSATVNINRGSQAVAHTRIVNLVE